MVTHALTSCAYTTTENKQKKNLLIVRQTVLDRVVLLEACDKYLSTVASVFVSLHSGLS